MALRHFYRNERRVRLGGWRLGPLAVGGGWYTVAPMTVLRVVQFVEACGALGMAANIGALAETLPAEVLRPLVPLWIVEPVKDRHLRHATEAQVTATYAAAGAVNDLPYMLEALTPGGDEGERGRGVEVLAVSVARELHLGDPEDVLRWPFQKLLATIDAMRSESDDLPPGAEPLSGDEQKRVDSLLSTLGMVN